MSGGGFQGACGHRWTVNERRGGPCPRCEEVARLRAEVSAERQGRLFAEEVTKRARADHAKALEAMAERDAALRERDEAREHARIAADAHRKEGDRAIAARSRLEEARGLLREAVRGHENVTPMLDLDARILAWLSASDPKEGAR